MFADNNRPQELSQKRTENSPFEKLLQLPKTLRVAPFAIGGAGIIVGVLGLTGKPAWPWPWHDDGSHLLMIYSDLTKKGVPTTTLEDMWLRFESGEVSGTHGSN